MNAFKFSIMAVLICCLGCGAQSCGATKNIDLTQMTGEWHLKTFRGDSVTAAFKGDIPSLTVDILSKTIHGNGGCNKYSGNYLINKKGLFSAPTLVKTLMACPNENEEDAYLQTLAIPSSLSINSDGELVFTQNKIIVMVFSKAKVLAVKDLTGVWKLQTIDGNAVSSLFTGKIPTIEFKDGRVQGSAGCNSYGGVYTLTNSGISIGGLLRTKMACPSMDGENKFVTLLGGDSHLSIVNEKLIFAKEGKPILTFTK